ncbi:MAG: GDSL-type esterase/lipase family protein, partial [Bacteroidota bacterium]
IVLYAGDNDLGTGVPELEILTNVKQLLEKIKLKYGAIPVAIISVKPSPDRKYLETAIKSLNRKLLGLASNDECCSFIDIYSKMLDTKGEIRPELYLEDELHINAKGYEIWKRIIKDHLIKH